jgi:hypothetical protein
MALILAVVVPAGGLIGCCGAVGWTCTRSEFAVPGLRVSYRTGGAPGAVTFVVRDGTGSPVPGVEVCSRSDSGCAKRATTDAAGRAVIRPGEREVLAVLIDGREVRFRPDSLETFCAPDCGDGLEVRAVLDP